MEPTVLGLILDTSVLVKAERLGLTIDQLLDQIRAVECEIEIAVSVITIAGLVHGYYRATTEDSRRRRRTFIEDLKNALPVHPSTGKTCEIIGGIVAEQEGRRLALPF